MVLRLNSRLRALRNPTRYNIAMKWTFEQPEKSDDQMEFLGPESIEPYSETTARLKWIVGYEMVEIKPRLSLEAKVRVPVG